MQHPFALHRASSEYWVERFVHSLSDIDRKMFEAESHLREMPDTPEFAPAMHGFCSFSPKLNTYFIRTPNIIAMIERQRDGVKHLAPKTLANFVDGCAFRSARGKAYYVFTPHLNLRNYTDTMDDPRVSLEAKRVLASSTQVKELHRSLARERMEGRALSTESCVLLDLSITHLLVHVALMEGRDMEYFINILRT